MTDWTDQIPQMIQDCQRRRAEMQQLIDLIDGWRDGGALGAGVRTRPEPPRLPGAVALPLPTSEEK